MELKKTKQSLILASMLFVCTTSTPQMHAGKRIQKFKNWARRHENKLYFGAFVVVCGTALVRGRYRELVKLEQFSDGLVKNFRHQPWGLTRAILRVQPSSQNGNGFDNTLDLGNGGDINNPDNMEVYTCNAEDGFTEGITSDVGFGDTDFNGGLDDLDIYDQFDGDDEFDGDEGDL